MSNSSTTTKPTATTLPTASIPISPRRATDESLVRSWGFSHVFTWSDGPNAHYPPHKHGGLTTHLIRRGEMTVTYPEDEGEKGGGRGKDNGTTFGVGARVDVEAGRVHEVWMGREGCEYVIGE